MRDRFIARLTEMALEDSRLMLVTGDLGFKVLDDFRARCPSQFINAGVAEQNMTGIATGLALSGKIVFTYSIGNFPTLRCLEQIRNDAAYHHANVNVVVIGTGFSYGALGYSHHATDDLGALRAIPEMTLVTPSTLWEASEATAALVERPGVSCLRLDKSHALESESPGSFHIGAGRVVRDGDAVTLVTCGGLLAEVSKAATILSERGLQARVVSMHTLKPLDHELLHRCARETGGIVTVEEHSLVGGLGTAVAESLMDAGCRPRVFERIGLPDRFSTIVGSQQYLRAHFGLDGEAVADRVARLLRGPAS